MFEPQIVSAGIYDGSIAQKGRSVSRSRATSMFEIELPLTEGGVSYVDGQSMPVSPATLICARAGQMRHTRFPFRCYYVHMIVPEDSTLYAALSALPVFVNTTHPEQYRAIFERLTEAYGRSGARDRLSLYSAVFALAYCLTGDANRQLSFQGEKGRGEVVRAAVQYIGECLNEDLSLTAMATRFGFSPVHFHRLFKEGTGVTLRAFVEGERIRRAADLIVSTDMTLTEIAYAVGFSSQSYFSAAFRRRTGMTPRAYERAEFARYEKEK